MTDAAIVALSTAVPLTITALGGFWAVVRRQKVVEAMVDIATKKVEENTVLTTDLANGRMSKLADLVDDLTEKLALSEANVARLVATEVGKTSTDTPTRAQEVIAKAEAVAAAVVQKAEERAEARIAEALRVAPRSRR